MSIVSLPAIRQIGVAVRAVVLATVVLGILYPLVMTGIGQALFGSQADGSLIRVHDHPVGSSLIGQSYTRQVIENGRPEVDANGNPVLQADPAWFQTRPSASDDNGLSSGASQLGPNNNDLVAEVAHRRAAVAALEDVAPDQVPADALTGSGSGLDPDISPAYAALQESRVARVRRLPVSEVRALVADCTRGRTLGFLGEPRVDVVDLNARLAALG